MTPMTIFLSKTRVIDDEVAELLYDFMTRTELTDDEVAELLYGVYCDRVGGVAFNGDRLPGWDEFAADPDKVKQANAWRAVGHAAKEMFLRDEN